MAAAGLAGLALGVVASGGRNTLVKLMALGGAAYAGKRLFRNQPPPFDSQRQLPPESRNHSFDPLNAPPVPTPEALSPFPEPARPEPQGFEGAARSNVAPPHLASAAMDSPPTKGSSDHPTPAPSGPASTEVESPPADLTGVILTLRGSIHAREAVRLTRPLLISPASHDLPEPESPPARLACDSVPAPQPSSPAASPWLAPPALSESETVPDQPAQTAPADPFSEPGPWIGSPQSLSQSELREQAGDGVPWLDLPPPSSLDRSSSLRQLASAAAQLRSAATAVEPRTPPPSLPQILPPPDSSGFAAEEDEVSVVELPDEDEAAAEPSGAEHSPFSITSQSQSPAQKAGDRLTPFQSRQRTQLPPPRSDSSGPFRPTA
ncbi:MAG TPA: hypothetical protein VMN36_07520, partial [Verrucomicrobiales bacterium]|nr:hypothetical protein [Verrucomicrobiales bacterium]